jgi:transposase
MTPPNLGDEQPHSGAATPKRQGKVQPMWFLGTAARDGTSPIRNVDPAFQPTAATTDRSAWHPPGPIARPQSAAPSLGKATSHGSANPSRSQPTPRTCGSPRGSPPLSTSSTSGDWPDSAPDLSCTDSTRDDAVDAEHQPTELAVGVRIPHGAPQKPRSDEPGLTALLAASGSQANAHGQLLRGRQPATGPPGSYPDRTHTGRRRRASDQVITVERPPPDHWAHRLEY